MSKKDKKIEIQLVDHTVTVAKAQVDGYQLLIGKRLVGEVAELDDKFAIISNGTVEAFYKNLEQAVEKVIENYNLNH
ncbi:DUF2969 domain-containing protein [Streptococcus halichoeri]|uniref:DUF2969 domain-containing protein n=1 Tax=Streptococcus halichoeri TaxID=254785 RepID=UPI00135A6A61|nr:DUF2969 domain-containing protein [Streptococcus halichoeri]